MEQSDSTALTTRAILPQVNIIGAEKDNNSATDFEVNAEQHLTEVEEDCTYDGSNPGIALNGYIASDSVLATEQKSNMAPNGSVGIKMKENSLQSVSTQNLKEIKETEAGQLGKGDLSLHLNASRVSLASAVSTLLHDEEAHHQVAISEPMLDDSGAGGVGSGTADQYIKDAIPYLPLPVAVTFLIMNIVLPGSGTIMCGMSVFVCGKSRFHSKDNNAGTTCCVNVSVGLSQMFTVTFMLVGWFWSLVWGIYMVIISVEYRKSKKTHQVKSKQADAVTAMNQSIRPWQLKTS